MSSPERTLLKRLSQRTQLVKQIREGGVDKRALTERLDVSRATIDRAVRELESAGVIERTGEGYALTLVGELAYAEFRRLLDRFETIARARELLLLLPREFEIDPAVLDDAEIVLAEQPLPHEPLERFEELIEECDRATVYSPIGFPTSIAAVHHQITGTETELELLLDERLVERLWTDYEEGLRNVLGAENATLRQLPPERGLDVMLASFDDRVVWIGVYDDDGDVRGAITLESDRALEWARDRLDRCREAGRKIPPPSEDEGEDE